MYVLSGFFRSIIPDGYFPYRKMQNKLFCKRSFISKRKSYNNKISKEITVRGLYFMLLITVRKESAKGKNWKKEITKNV